MLETTKITESEQRAEAARDKLHGSNKWPMPGSKCVASNCAVHSYPPHDMHRQIWKLDQA